MMNEDTKDLLKMIKNTTKYIDARLTLDAGCCKCLLEYIDELHNKIDKAIEYVKKNKYGVTNSMNNLDIEIYIDTIIKLLKDSDVDE